MSQKSQSPEKSQNQESETWTELKDHVIQSINVTKNHLKNFEYRKAQTNVQKYTNTQILAIRSICKDKEQSFEYQVMALKEGLNVLEITNDYHGAVSFIQHVDKLSTELKDVKVSEVIHASFLVVQYKLDSFLSRKYSTTALKKFKQLWFPDREIETLKESAKQNKELIKLYIEALCQYNPTQWLDKSDAFLDLQFAEELYNNFLAESEHKDVIMSIKLAMTHRYRNFFTVQDRQNVLLKLGQMYSEDIRSHKFFALMGMSYVRAGKLDPVILLAGQEAKLMAEENPNIYILDILKTRMHAEPNNKKAGYLKTITQKTEQIYDKYSPKYLRAVLNENINDEDKLTSSIQSLKIYWEKVKLPKNSQLQVQELAKLVQKVVTGQIISNKPIAFIKSWLSELMDTDSQKGNLTLQILEMILRKYQVALNNGACEDGTMAQTLQMMPIEDKFNQVHLHKVLEPFFEQNRNILKESLNKQGALDQKQSYQTITRMLVDFEKQYKDFFGHIENINVAQVGIMLIENSYENFFENRGLKTQEQQEKTLKMMNDKNDYIEKQILALRGANCQYLVKVYLIRATIAGFNKQESEYNLNINKLVKLAHDYLKSISQKLKDLTTSGAPDVVKLELAAKSSFLRLDQFYSNLSNKRLKYITVGALITMTYIECQELVREYIPESQFATNLIDHVKSYQNFLYLAAGIEREEDKAEYASSYIFGNTNFKMAELLDQIGGYQSQAINCFQQAKSIVQTLSQDSKNQLEYEALKAKVDQVSPKFEQMRSEIEQAKKQKKQKQQVKTKKPQNNKNTVIAIVALATIVTIGFVLIKRQRD